MNVLIQHRMKNIRMKERIKKLQEGNDIKASFQRVKAVILGVLVLNEVYNLNNPKLLRFLLEGNIMIKISRKESEEKYLELLKNINKNTIAKEKGYNERNRVKCGQ